ncbi:3779_t:CDS:1, partial [Racocetra fulgida]
MPYMAPELLSGGSYSQKTDVYAFGIIIWEICSERKPFADRNHNTSLALDICRGLRPEITKDTPVFLQDLMPKCWHTDPAKRPTANEIHKQIISWYECYEEEILVKEIQDQINEENNNIRIKELQFSHPGAIYTSRLMTNIIG